MSANANMEIERVFRENEMRREDNMKLFKRIDDYEADHATLRAENADLRRRIRLARGLVWNPNEFDYETHERVLALLDLRKPLPRGRR